MMKIAIIGAGITGLTIANKLLKRGHEIKGFESKQPGGLAFGFPFPDGKDIYLDKYYHHIFKSDREIIRLIQENGLESDLVWLESKSGIFSEGQTWPLSTLRDLLACFPIGSLWQRLLMGWNLYDFRQRSDWKHLDAVRCREFFEQRGNLIGYKNLWEPLLQQKYSDAFDEIPASFLWGRIHPRSQSREKGKETLGYLRGGFQRLILSMVESIQKRGGVITTGNPILQIVSGDKPEVIYRKGREVFDRVVCTIGLNLLSSLVKDISQEIKQKAISIEYMAVTCLIIVMKKRQGDFYWLNNIDPGVSFGAVIEHTNFVSPEHYGGNYILYVVNYHRHSHDLNRLKAREVLNMHLPSLRKVFPDFSQKDIVCIYLFKDSHSSPLYDLWFSERIPPYQGWLPNVDICSMAQVYPEDRNMNHCIQNALNYVTRFCENSC
ncbi:MAG: FAD-dependent oxidoreductase [Candidatus Mariimomonas ferrooxydans]